MNLFLRNELNFQKEIYIYSSLNNILKFTATTICLMISIVVFIKISKEPLDLKHIVFLAV